MVDGFLKKIGAVLLFALTLSAHPAMAATLIGDQVTINYLYPNANTQYYALSGLPATVTVKAGTSDQVTARQYLTPLFTVNVEAASVVVTFLRNLTFNSAAFSGVGIFGINANVASVSSTGATGIASLSNNNVLINLAGRSFRTGASVTAVLQFANTTGVPLPATFPLLGAALGGLALFRRGRKRKLA